MGKEEICERCKPFFESLLKEIIELKRRLLAYENAHTPPSKNRRHYPKREPTGNPVGAPQGHPGTTRSTPTPDKIVDVKQAMCEECQHSLGKPAKIMKRIIEDIPEPRSVIVTQYNVHTYICGNCATVNIPAHPDLPAEGRFGKNLMTEIALLKCEDRLPLEKIADNLQRQYHLDITPAAVLEILERVTGSCETVYNNIRQQIKQSSNVYADETGQKVQGQQWWTWAFTTFTHVLFLIRKSRGQAPVEEVLGDEYQGILNCDGWKPYSKKVKKIQRCWAHLLREAKWLAEKEEGQARLLYQELCEMFRQIKQLRITVLAQQEREKRHDLLVAQMRQLIDRTQAYTELRKFAVKIENGLEHWFTCVLYPEAEPTNNRAERALREIVVQRKITGTLRNEKGTHRTEVLMTCLQTWKLQGLNTLTMLRHCLS
jgi:transposase